MAVRTPEWNNEQLVALIRHGYAPDAFASGATGRSQGDTSTWDSAHADPAERVLLRYHVCFLDGIEIDGHEGSDLDPGSSSCIHCPYEGPNP